MEKEPEIIPEQETCETEVVETYSAEENKSLEEEVDSQDKDCIEIGSSADEEEFVPQKSELTRISFPEDEKSNYLTCSYCQSLIFYTKQTTNFVQLTTLYAIESFNLEHIVEKSHTISVTEFREIQCRRCGYLLGLHYVILNSTHPISLTDLGWKILPGSRSTHIKLLHDWSKFSITQTKPYRENKTFPDREFGRPRCKIHYFRGNIVEEEPPELQT